MSRRRHRRLPIPVPAPPTRTAKELPRGGTTLFPRYRLVGYAGAPGSPAFGRLGIGNLDDRVAEIEKRAHSYDNGRQPLPVLELVATVVHASPGSDGKYRGRMSDSVIEDFLRAARRHHALLLLNIQPGRATFLDEARAYRKWLLQRDVGLALDPEWSMAKGQVPGRVFGHTTGRQLDQVAAYVSSLVTQNSLPEKAIVHHQLSPGIVSRESELRDHEGVVMIKSVDGIGTRAQKISTWHKVIKSSPEFVHPGFKLFLEEDREHGPLMTPPQVLALKPTPEYVLYE